MSEERREPANVRALRAALHAAWDQIEELSEELDLASDQALIVGEMADNYERQRDEAEAVLRQVGQQGEPRADYWEKAAAEWRADALAAEAEAERLREGWLITRRNHAEAVAEVERLRAAIRQFEEATDASS